jgi:hypothetical protein
MTDMDTDDSVAADGVRLLLDRDFQREGFNPEGLEGEGLTVGFSERLGADPWLIALLVGTGWRTLDALTKNATSRAIDRLLDFSRSRDKKLKFECEARNIDTRVEILMTSIETMSRAEFDTAVRALPALKDQANAVLLKADDPIRELYFVWQDGRWEFSYYISVSGDVIDELAGDA